MTAPLVATELLWVDGAPADRLELDPADEGLLYGRGLFETTRTFAHTPWLWETHGARLQRSAEHLGIPLDPARVPSAAAVANMVAHRGQGDVALRLNLSAGVAGRPGSGKLWLTARPLPPTPAALRVTLCPHRMVADDPLACHKTFNYWPRLAAQRQAEAAGYDTALLLSTADLVLEAAMANLFVQCAGQWLTPPAGPGSPVLPGTVRDSLLALGDAFPCGVQPLPLPALAEVTAAFLCNSVRGLMPIAELAGRALALPDGLPALEPRRHPIPR